MMMVVGGAFAGRIAARRGTMEDKNSLVKTTMMVLMAILVSVTLIVSILTKSVVFFLGVAIPLLTFFVIFIFMTLQRKKILKQLNVSFGQNVVRIAEALMDYFELPIMLLLSITLTLFFFAFSVLALIFWATRLSSMFNLTL